MIPILDNPAWNALISGNQNLANGTERVKYFDKEVSPFAAFEADTPDNFRELYDMMPHDRPVLIVTSVETEVPAPWKLLNYIPGLQMVYDGVTPLADKPSNLTPLTTQHVPQMLELTKLTNPGPFGTRTIEFGHYHGIFDADRLVAMAGQRMHPFNYAEISAVCTHPDHLGRGYARQVLLHQMHRIIAEGNTPFLHVRDDNTRAIQVYKSLGFKTRIPVHFYVWVK